MAYVDKNNHVNSVTNSRPSETMQVRPACVCPAWQKTAIVRVRCNVVSDGLNGLDGHYKHFAKHACDFSLTLLEPCNFLYK